MTSNLFFSFLIVKGRSLMKEWNINLISGCQTKLAHINCLKKLIRFENSVMKDILIQALARITEMVIGQRES